MIPALTSDELARQHCREQADSVLLQAPAGSGKTTVLVERFLALLSQVDLPEQILAITFTRKAAAEMRRRIVQILRAPDVIASASNTDPRRQVLEQLKAAVKAQALRRGWNWEGLPSRLRIQTIDSFNHELARAMPILGRSPGSLQVLDSVRPLYQLAAERTLIGVDQSGGKAAQDSAESDAIDQVLERLDNDMATVTRLLAQLLEKRSHWLPLLLQHGPDELGSVVESALVRVIEATLNAARRVHAAQLEEAEALARAAAINRQTDGHAPDDWIVWLAEETQLQPTAQALRAWQTVADLLLTEKNQPRKLVNKGQGFPPNQRTLKDRWQQWQETILRSDPECEHWIRLRKLPSVPLAENDQRALGTLARLMIQSALELKLVFQEHGVVDHSEVASIARQALVAGGQPTEWALERAHAVQHLLVDECQDLSPQQMQLLETLVALGESVPGHSLFMVGDPMQSIYLFRDAEVGLFVTAREHGVAGRPLVNLQLQRNFRATAELVDWCNRALSKCFPPIDDLLRSAIAFAPSVAGREAPQAQPRIDAGSAITINAEAAVQVWASDEDDAPAEAQRIAAEIERVQTEHVDWSIAILVRTRAQAAPVLDALRQRNIAALAVDIDPLNKHPVVLELLALGALLLQEADRVAWFSVLRSPACGLTLADLSALAARSPEGSLRAVMNDPASWSELTTSGQKRLARCAPLLLESLDERGRVPLWAQIDRLWHRLGSDLCFAPEQRVAASAFIHELQEQTAIRPPVTLQDLEALTDRLFATPETTLESPAIPTKAPAVQVMTIHHAKGLEWDVVFLPRMGKTTATGDAPLLRWIELPGLTGQSELLMAVHSLGVGDEPKDPLTQCIAGLKADRELQELTRLAYVAVTRAAKRLYLSGHVKSSANLSHGETPAETKPPRNTLLHALWPALAEDFRTAQSTRKTDGTQPPLNSSFTPLQAPRLRRVTDAFDPAAGLPRLPAVMVTPRRRDQNDAALEFEWVGPAARAAGTVAHQELERLANQAQVQTEDLESRRAHLQTQLLQLGVTAEQVAATTEHLIGRLRSLQQVPLARWLIHTPHREASAERRLSGVVDGILHNVVIDRMFVDESGVRWVIDYKTSTHSGGGLEEFLQSELTRYAPQLRLYQALAKGLGPEPVRAGLYFPWLGVLKTLDQGPVLLSSATDSK